MTAPAISEASVREAARSAFDESLTEERERANGPFTPYPAAGSGNWHTPPPAGPVRSTLPGKGSYGPGCGAKVPLGWLASDGDLPLGIHRCARRECPRCARKHEASECGLGVAHGGGDWADAEGLEVAAKLQGYAATLDFGFDRPLRQVIVSPPLERYNESDHHGRTIERVRRAAAKALRELGWEGAYWASLVVHLYRGCEHDGYAEWGPHAHAVGSGVDVRLTAEYFRRTGVVVKQATEDGTPGSAFVGYWGKSLVRHLVYELGHAAIVPDGHAVSYLGRGLVSFSAPTPEPLELEDGKASEPRCPHGLPFAPLGDGSPPRFDSETREWTFRASRDGRFFRFLDRAPAQGGLLLERVDLRGRAVAVAISPYLDRTGLGPPPRARWRGRPSPGVPRSDEPWDAPGNWPEVSP